MSFIWIVWSTQYVYLWIGYKTSVQVVTPVCTSVCKSHDIMLRQQKKCNTFSTLYFAERNWKKMRTPITMNVFCTAASSKYWRMKIDLDFIWLLHTIFGKLLMQLSGNHVSPGKGIAKTSTMYLHNWHKLQTLRLKFFPFIVLLLRRESRCGVVNFQAF